MPARAVPLESRAERRLGTQLRGKYRIERVIGTGGMATVYAAVHRNGHRVAIKMLHEHLSVHGETSARFLREGYVANRVGHPGAVRVIDDDVAEDGSAFLVMELLRGETLRARGRRAGGRLPVGEVLALGHQLLDVLAAAHAAGVVHRDIKPENLFLTTDRVLKVLDFGIARLEDPDGAFATATGVRLGTPAFMPPELALGRTAEIDGRTDVWCVGAALFTLLSGQIVHRAEAAAEIVVRAATVPARPLADAAPDVPAEVRAVVDRALRFHREDRWPSARAMRDAVAEAFAVLYGEPVSPAAIDPTVGTDGAEPGTATTEVARKGGPPLFAGGEARDGRTLSASSPDDPRPQDAETQPDVARTATAPLANQTTRPELLSHPAPTPPPAITPPAPPTPAVEPPARPRRPAWTTRAIAVAAAAITLATAAAYLGGRRAEHRTPAGAASASGASAPTASPVCAVNADCGGGVCSRAGRCFPRVGCAEDRACIAANGGAPSLCRKEDGVCVALETEACKVLAEPGDLGDDATVWIGAMWPYRVADPLHFGPRSANAVDLARRDFAGTAGGLPPARPGGPRRPLAVVLCDDRRSPDRAAAHLVDDLRVPAVLGFASSKEVLDLAPGRFVPAHVLVVVATGSATTIRDLRPAPGETRLVWRVTPATDAASAPLAAVLAQVVEPEIAALPGVLRPGEPLRVAQLRQDSLVGHTIVASRIATLRFNGKSVAENGDAFRLIARADDLSGADLTAANDRTARAIAAFLPHVVVDMPPSPALLSAIERAWPARAPFRPRYLTEGNWIDLGGPSLDVRRFDLYRRLHDVDLTSLSPPLVRFALRYNEMFAPRVTPATAPSTPYDAFYIVAYAVAALRDAPLTGPSLARAFARLMPPGAAGSAGPPPEPVDVGPGGIYPALLALSMGRNLDLQGTAGALDLDPATGETTAAWALYCVAPGAPNAPAAEVPSGLTFDPKAGKLVGTRRCP